MDAIRNSRKRNHRSPPPSSTLTRSRTQLLLHRNRSGQIRSDPVPIQEKHYPVPVPFVGNVATQRFSDLYICKEYCESDSDDNVLVKDLRKKAKHGDGDLACAKTKDLRARRVYSPLSSAGASSGVIGSALSNVSAVDSDEEIAKLGFGSESSTQNVVIEPTEVPELGFGSHSSGKNGNARVIDGKIQPAEITDLGLSCEPQNFDRGNIESSYESPKLQVHVQNGGGNGGDCSEKIDDLGEEHVLTTPPDAVICSNIEVNTDARKTEETLLTEGFSGTKDGLRNSSILKSKSVLKPRLPGRLFKAPGSVNYRRLMNIMGADFGIPKLSGQGLKLPLSSDNHEGSKPETVTDSCIMRDTEEVNDECLSMPSVDLNDKCSSESKVDPTAGFCGARDVGNALDHGDYKQGSINGNNLDCDKATNQNSDSEQLDVLNEGCTAMAHDNIVLSVDQMQIMPKDACHVKPMDLTKSTQENAIEALCPKADTRNEPLKSKYVNRPYLHGKLIKTPGSVNYKRLLPYLKNLTKDDSGTSKFGDQTHHNKDGANLYAQEFQLPLPSQSEEASMNRKMSVCDLVQDRADSNALENDILVNPANMSSHGNRPKLTSSQDFTELPMQLDAKEMVHECLSGPSVQVHSEKAEISSKDECLSESMIDPCSVMMDFHCAKTVPDGGFNQVHNTISRQNSSEPPPKDQNLLNINDDIPNISFEHHSSNEKGFTVDYDEREQFVNLEEHESVSRCPPKGQSLCQLDPNMLDTKESETSGHAISKSDDAVVLSHVSISNEKPRPELPEIAAHGGDKAGSLLNGLVYGSKMPSKGSNKKNASFSGEIENGSQSKTTQVLNRCPRMKLFKHAGSFNYKRLLPILLETVESNSCASNNDHHSKVQKLLDHRPLPISDGCVSMDDSTGNSGAQQETELQACDLNIDSSSPISQLQDKQIILNGLYQLENSVGSPISVHRDLLVTPSGPITDEVITREEEATPVLSTEEKSPETLGCLSKLKVTDQFRSPAADFRKGILRRNPRGCRGLCTCLNCASFRLHAERAFEFSRNQLLDAEEVAQDLMKEVSHLRNMLESYTDSDSVNDTPIFNGSQVKEACRKAFETEQLAKDRLSQMNDDLNIHCRTPNLQRPSVKFSDHVKEKIIQSDR
ncbi:hypothetical protein L195_g003175 [Trifolium pratense]|uniref:Uncharacterized protein n=1 Tax=Trifolium pratense TaxID=57577 RepID=A0A2K3NUI1_TRIPR|nr:hypothetical protein L195_g003175 [Trifolium pratense]